MIEPVSITLAAVGAGAGVGMLAYDAIKDRRTSRKEKKQGQYYESFPAQPLPIYSGSPQPSYYVAGDQNNYTQYIYAPQTRQPQYGQPQTGQLQYGQPQTGQLQYGQPQTYYTQPPPPYYKS